MILNKLQVFKTVYESGNTTEAAARLNVTRSAVSQTLSKLEHELGVSLFTRLAKGIVATPAGHQLAQSVAPLLNQLNDEVLAVANNQKSNAGIICIGAPKATGSIHLPRIIELFNRNHPDVEIRLTLNHSNELLKGVLQGQLDLALIDVYGGELLHRDLHAYCLQQTILTETVVMLCSPDYFNNKVRGDLSYENLASLECLTTGAGLLEIKSWFHQQFGRTPKYLRRRLVADSGLAVVDCTCRGLGVCVIGSNISQDYVDRGELVEITPHIRGEANQINLIQLLDKKPSAMEKAFIRQITEYADREWRSGV